jgi:hypothetical protein
MERGRKGPAATEARETEGVGACDSMHCWLGTGACRCALAIIGLRPMRMRTSLRAVVDPEALAARPASLIGGASLFEVADPAAAARSDVLIAPEDAYPECAALSEPTKLPTRATSFRSALTTTAAERSTSYGVALNGFVPWAQRAGSGRERRTDGPAAPDPSSAAASVRRND